MTAGAITGEHAFWHRLRLVKPEPYRSLPYLAFIRTWPCIVCGNPVVQAMHSGEHGLGTKASDFRVLPGCYEHHQGPRGLDQLGPEAFERLYNIDLKDTILKLIEIYLSQGNSL